MENINEIVPDEAPATDTEAKDYDSWNELKKKVQFSTNTLAYFPKEGEVWISLFGKNIGIEQNGGGSEFLRPILVIKKFNNQMFWSIPLSTKQKLFDFCFNFTDPNDQKVSAILAQLKLVSIKRFKRKLYEMQPELFCAIKEKLKDFLL